MSATTEYLDALDKLEANKDKIANWDILSKYNTLYNHPRRIEAAIDDVGLAELRRDTDEETERRDRKYGRKYWEGLAQEVGIRWIA